jgi:hypothetical protein
MIIGKDMKMIKNDPSTSKLLSLPTFDMEVNLYSSVVTTGSGRTKLLMKSPTNDRIQRARAESTQKACTVPLLVNPKLDDSEVNISFADYPGAFGDKWSQDVMQDDSGQRLPSLNELMEGIINWYIQ